MATLTITFKGVDEVGTAAHQVADDIKDVGQAADSAKEKGTGFFGGLLQSAGGFLAANVIGTITSQVTGFVGDAISSARESNQVMAQTEQIIKTTGGAAGMSAEQVADLASSLSAAAGRSLFGDEDVQGAENVILKYRELKGLVPDVTKLAVDMAQRLGTEPAAAANTLSLALQKPFDAQAKLAKQGIILTDQQQAMLAKMKAVGDTAGAQKFLIDQLNKTYGGSAQAAADADGGMAQFQDRMGEVKETLGKALLPVLGALIGILNDHVMPIVEELAAQVLPALSGAWEALQPTINAVMGLFTSAGGSATGLGGFLGDLQGAATEVWTAIQTQLIPIFKDLGEAVWPAVVAAGQILAGLYTDVLKPAIHLVWDLLTNVFFPALAVLASWLKDTLPPVIQGVADFLTQTLFPAFHTVYDFIDQNIVPILSTLVTWLKINIPPPVQALATLWTTVLQPALSAVWGFIDKNIIPIFSALVSIHIAAVKTAVGDLATLWTGTLQPALSAVWGFINTNIIPIFSALVDTHIAAVKTAVGELAAVWNTTLQPALQGIKDFIVNTVQPALNTFKTDYIDKIASAFGSIETAIGDVITKIGELLTQLASVVIPDFLKGHSPPPMANWFSDIADAAGAVNAEIGRMRFPQQASIPLLSGGSASHTAFGGANTAQGFGGRGGGAAVVRLSIDDRGLGWLKNLIRVEVVHETDRIARIADARGRTR